MSMMSANLTVEPGRLAQSSKVLLELEVLLKLLKSALLLQACNSRRHGWMLASRGSGDVHNVVDVLDSQHLNACAGHALESKTERRNNAIS